MRSPVVLILALTCAVSTAWTAERPALSVVSIPLAENGGLERLQRRLSLDFMEVGPRTASALVNPYELRLLSLLDIEYTILYSDAEELARRVRPSGIGAYHTYASSVEMLQGWASRLPEVVTLTTIGQSVEGRPIVAARIAAPGAVPLSERPKVLIMGLHHAREWISVEVPLALVDRLLTGYGSDARMRSILEGRVLWVVPVVNPDGLEYSQRRYSMWRKNRHKTWSLPITNGVDPNRNYGFQWMGHGSSRMPFSEVYRGKAPFSEPENQAIKALAEAERFTASISFHSYSELVLYPWGYTHDPCPDDALFRQVAGEMAAINHYHAQVGADLYIVNGECDDWLYGTQGTVAFTIELGTSFIPRDSQIPNITGPNVDASLHLLERAASLRQDPRVVLHLIERLSGAPWAPRGPWSPGRAADDTRRATLAWATHELVDRLLASPPTFRDRVLSDIATRVTRDGRRAPTELTEALRAVVTTLGTAPVRSGTARLEELARALIVARGR